MPRLNQRAYTLVEIMIVLAIIGLLIGIAIPILLRARLSANEKAAKASIRAIMTALENYRTDQNPPTYPDSLATLGGLMPPYLEPLLTGGSKNGYNYAYYPAPQLLQDIGGVSYTLYPEYSIGATPLSSGMTGNTTFYANSSGVIYEDSQSPYSDPGMLAYTATAPLGFT